MADYSNRGFFTTGTNFDVSAAGSYPHNTYPYPESDNPAYGEVTWSKNWAGGPLLDSGQVTMLAGTVHDSLPNGHVAHDVPLTTLGVFDEYLEKEHLLKRYTLNRYNYDAMADLLIPRAVAYGAGLIDYFFRGRLAISLPDEGIYGVIDHSTSHTVSGGVPVDGTGKVFGFKKIILNVANVTPDIKDKAGSYSQNIGVGNIRAVAHYRYDPCYTPDLSGEATCSESEKESIKNQPMQISTSAKVDVSSIVRTGTNKITFDFSEEPIPINATDLRIQVVFRGQLGSEADAIAVCMRDISEPTYLTFRNTTDYFSFYGTRYRVAEPNNELAQLQQEMDSRDDHPAASVYSPFNTLPGSVRIANAYNVVTTPVLLYGDASGEHYGDYIRVALLADNGDVNVGPDILPFDNYSFYVATRYVQEDDDKSKPYRFKPLASMGEESNLLFSSAIVRLTRYEYPSALWPAPAVFNHFPPVPQPTPVTIGSPFDVPSP